MRTWLVFLLSLAAWPARAATFSVTSQLDVPDAVLDGVCSAGPEMLCTLRAAVQEANATPAVADTIVLPAGVYGLDTTTLGAAGEDAAGTGDLDVTSPITIQGAGMDVTVVEAAGDGLPQDRVFHVLSTGDLVIEDASVRFGRAIAAGTFTGGGIRNEGGLELRRCRVEQNRANAGGGVWSGGELLVEECTFSENEASDDGFTNADGGGLVVQGDAAVVRASTFSANQCAAVGSAIYVWNQGSLLLENSTLSGNLGGVAGSIRLENADATLTHVTLVGSQTGVSAFSFDGTDQLVFENSVVTAVGANNCNFSASPPTILRNNGNLEDTDGSCGFAFTTADVMLAALADNGGPTATHLPETGSPVVDQAQSAECLATDQRGELRPDLTGGPGLCDVGAVELLEPGRQLLAAAALGSLALVARGRRRP